MKEVDKAVQDRYARESCGDDYLSCGQALDLAGIKPGERVLDLGCGRGADVIRAAFLVGPAGEAVGVDLTPEMITEAEKNRQAAEVSNARLITAAMENLPLADGEFTAVISNCAINHSRNKELVYREIYRVLSPGGRMVVSDVVAQEKLPATITADPEAWADCFGGAIPEEEYFTAIRAAGFQEIQVLERREYLKNDYPMASLTIKASKPQKAGELQ